MKIPKGLLYFRRGKKTFLRPVLREDAKLFIRWINDPEVSRFLLAHHPMMEKHEEDWIDSMTKDKESSTHFVILDERGKPIGTTGLRLGVRKDGVATTGTLIGEKSAWGKGYGTDAKMVLLDYTFNTLNLRKVCSSVLAFNERSLRCQLRCGYKEEGRLAAHIYREGAYHDEILLAVWRDDFLPLWKEYSKGL